MEQVDGYRERADIKLGTEPLNTLTNLGVNKSWLSVPKEMAAELPQRKRQLIKYSIHPPFMGYIDGVQPQKSLQTAKKNSQVLTCLSPGSAIFLWNVDFDHARIVSHAHLVRSVFYRSVAGGTYSTILHFYASA